MKNRNWLSKILLSLLLGTALFMTGCDGDDDGPESPAVNVSGTWSVSLSGGGKGNMVLVQNGNSIQGTSSEGDQISGSIEGSSISITVIPSTPGDSIQLDGTASETTMSGSYSATIDGTDDDGTWSALKMLT